MEQLKTTLGKISSTIGAIITSGSAETREIIYISLTNKHSSPQAIQLWFVPNNAGSVGVAATDGVNFLTHTIDVNETFIWDKPMLLESQNDTIQAVAAENNTVHFLTSYIRGT